MSAWEGRENFANRVRQAGVSNVDSIAVWIVHMWGWEQSKVARGVVSKKTKPALCQSVWEASKDEEACSRHQRKETARLKWAEAEAHFWRS